MAPELFQEGGVHSFASDLWALGCVMYECFAGRPPFVSSSFTHLVNAILSDATPALQGNPSKEFEDLILCLLTKDPAKRLQWSELCQHPFWRVKLKPLPLPPQPAFANSLRLLQRMSTSGADGGAHGLSTNAQKKSSHDQHASRLERAIKKAETQVGQRKNSATPSRDTDSAATHANSTGAHKKPCHDQAVPRLEKPASKQSNPMEVRNLPPLKEDSRQKNCAVNILRLSRIVKCNLQRETQGGNSGQQASNAPANDTDVTIDNNDLELDFAERVEGDSNDDDDEVADVPPSADVAGCSEDIGAGGAPSFVKDDEQIRLQCDKGAVVSGAERESEALEKSNGASKKAEEGRVAVAATPPGVGVGVGVARKARRVPILAHHAKKRGVDRKAHAPTSTAATTRWL